MITTQLVPVTARHELLIAAKKAVQIRSAKLVVERGRADGAFEHDRQRRSDAFRFAVIDLPRLHRARDTQVRHTETGQPGLGPRAPASRSLIADLTTGAGRRPRVRRNRGRVIVGLDLDQDRDRLAMVGIYSPTRAALTLLAPRKEAPGVMPLDNRRVVRISGQDAVSRQVIGIADHREQRLDHHLAVDGPVGIEHLVPTVLGIDLGEHHQLDIRRIAPHVGKVVDQIIDFIVGQCQPHLGIGPLQRRTPATEQVNPLQRCRVGMQKQALGLIQIGEHRFGHAVMQQMSDPVRIDFSHRIKGIGHPTLDSTDPLQTTDPRYLGRATRPWTQGPRPRHHQQHRSVGA